jgi:non-specific serine/threonine protein kinase
MIRRLPRDRPARTPDGDADALRTAASAANDVVDAVSLLSAARLAHGMGVVAQRYARALDLGPRDLHEALQAARVAVRTGRRVATVSIDSGVSAGAPGVQ